MTNFYYISVSSWVNLYEGFSAGCSQAVDYYSLIQKFNWCGNGKDASKCTLMVSVSCYMCFSTVLLHNLSASFSQSELFEKEGEWEREQEPVRGREHA